MSQIINAYLYCTVLPLIYFMEQTYESGALWVLLTPPIFPDFLDRRGGGGGGGSALLFHQGGKLLFQLLSFRSPECTYTSVGWIRTGSIQCSWFRIRIPMRRRIRTAKSMRIHSDLDPQHWCPKIAVLHFKYKTLRTFPMQHAAERLKWPERKEENETIPDWTFLETPYLGHGGLHHK